MKTLTTFIMLLMLGIGAQAHLGETPQQCVARYGNPTGMDEKQTTFFFTKEGVNVHATFDGGKCVKLILSKQAMGGLLRRDFDDHEVRMLLAANSAGQTWEKSSGFVDDEWVTEKRDLCATHEGVTRRLVIMTQEQSLKEWADQQRAIEADRAAKEAKTAAERSKLKGF